VKRVILYNLFLLVAIALHAQDITIEAEYPSAVEAGQQFSIAWTINSGGGEFSAPPFEGFYKLMGPQTSYSSSTQIINGKMSHRTTYSYLYYLQALNEGTFVIPPASYTLKNKTYYSDSIRIEVLGTGASRQNVQTGANTGTASKAQPAGGDVSVDLSLNRNEVYIGEHIAATVKIYTKVDLSGINEIKYPPFTGFLKSDIETPPLTQLRQENINGTIYGTGVIQNFLLFPQVTGEITIDPVQISVLVRQKSAQTDPFFGDFFSNFQTVQLAVISPLVKVNVKPLPGTKPGDFSGVVGKLDLKATINKDSVDVNDAVNLKIAISGNGNLKLAEAPKLTLSPDIEIYDPKVTDNIKNSLSGTSGQRTFEYLLIPRHYGDFTIPPVTYTYFNTSSGKYETLTSREFRFYARKGTESATGITVYGGVSKEDVKYVGKDIRFVKSDPGKLTKSVNNIISKTSFYSIYIIAFLIFLIVLFIRREHTRRNADLTAVRNRKAGKIAGKRLKDASACMKRGEMDRFHEEILKAIWGYLSDKLNIPVSDLTRSNAVTALKEKGISDEDINSLTGILDICEYARYAPAESGTEAASIYEGTARFIRSVENSIIR
jgi:hypothetical protein